MPSTNYACVNGRFVPEDRAQVSITDRGFLYGDGAFETIRVYGGRMFRAVEHMERLFAGLAYLDILALFSPEELRAVCRVLLERNHVADGVVRVYVTRDSLVATARGTLFEPRTLSAVVSSITIDPQWSRFKTANRLPYILAQRQAATEGADEAVLLNPSGKVAEFCTSNVFVAKDGELFTPPLTDGPLPGIARRAVIELAGEMKIPVREESFAPEFLESADEVFATNSLLEIAPVTSWGGDRVFTERLQRAYQKRVAEETGR